MSSIALRRWLLFSLLVTWGLGYIAVFVWLLHHSRDFIAAARIDAACSAPAQLAALSQSFSSVEAAATRNMRAAGWAAPEPWGMWSAADRAVLVLPVPTSLRQRAAALQLHLLIPVNEQVPSQSVHVDLGGRTSAHWQLGFDAADRTQRIEFAAGELATKPCIDIGLRFDNAYRPQKLDRGPDRRLLGIGLERITWVDLDRERNAAAEPPAIQH